LPIYYSVRRRDHEAVADERGDLVDAVVHRIRSATDPAARPDFACSSPATYLDKPLQTVKNLERD
jgi:hypothetical protein